MNVTIRLESLVPFGSEILLDKLTPVAILVSNLHWDSSIPPDPKCFYIACGGIVYKIGYNRIAELKFVSINGIRKLQVSLIPQSTGRSAGPL